MFLLTHVGSDTLLIHAHSTYAIPARPALAPDQRSLGAHQLTMDTNRALSLQVSQRHRHAVLWGNTQHHVDMVRHRVAFHQFNLLLPAQLPQDFSYLLSPLAVEDFSTVLWYDH